MSEMMISSCSLAPDSSAAKVATAEAGYANVQKVLEQRCYQCHGAQLQMKNVRLDTPAALKTHAQGVYQQVAVLKIMPPGNLTGLTEPERQLLDRWYRAGARRD